MFDFLKSRSEAELIQEYMPWSPDYELGVKMIDDDHRQLFDASAQLYIAVKKREGHMVIKATFDMLTQYVAEHFQREEQMMREADYPDLKNHEQLHASFIQAFFSTKQSYVVAPKAFDFDGFLDFLKNWLVHHVLEQDPKYVPYVTEKPDEVEVNGPMV